MKENDEDVRISPVTGKPIDPKHALKAKRKAKKVLPKVTEHYAKLHNAMVPNAKPGDITKYLNLNTELFNLPDIDIRNPDEVLTRLNEYFNIYAKYDTKPTVAGMATALGMSRQNIYSIVNGNDTGGNGYKNSLPRDITDVIKKAYILLENMHESYMMDGKVNPVTGIFMAKNHYGYVDKTEHVVTPNQRSEDEYSADEIRQRYLEDKTEE